jgi:hypothetical protein
MASENKKRKAKNSFHHNAGMKCDGRSKYIYHYCQRERQQNKREAKQQIEQEITKNE